MAWAASEAAPIRPISRAEAPNRPTSKVRMARNRQADAQHFAKARPVGTPEAPEHVVAPEPLVQEDDEGEAGAHQCRRERRRDAGAHDAERRKAQIAEHSAPSWRTR